MRAVGVSHKQMSVLVNLLGNALVGNAVLGIGKLTAAAKGQAVAAAVLHLHGLSLEKVDRGGFFDFGHCQTAEDFQVASPG